MKNLSILFIAFLLINFTTLAQEGWFEQTSGTSTFLHGVDFIDANTGAAVSADGIILRTSNGGQTWEPQYSNSATYLWDICLPDANTGIAVG